MLKGASATRGRELNLHFSDLERGFIGHVSPLGDMVCVMAGVTLSFKMRGEDRVGLVYVGDGATSTGAFTRDQLRASAALSARRRDRKQSIRVFHTDR